MIRNPVEQLAAAGRFEGAHALYHVALLELLESGGLTAEMRRRLRADLPWFNAFLMSPAELGFASLEEAAEAIAAADDYVKRTNHVAQERGCILQVPFVEEGAHVDSRAELSGGVYVSRGAFIAPEAVVRMDEKSGLAPMVIGEQTNVQDEVLVHADGAAIGARCIVAHDAVVHGAVLEDDVTIYIKAVIDTGAHVEQGAFVDAGGYVGRGVRIPSGRYVAPLTAVCTAEAALALPEITDAQRRMRAEVLAHNAEHARRYVSGQREALLPILAGE